MNPTVMNLPVVASGLIGWTILAAMASVVAWAVPSLRPLGRHVCYIGGGSTFGLWLSTAAFLTGVTLPNSVPLEMPAAAIRYYLQGIALVFCTIPVATLGTPAGAAAGYGLARRRIDHSRTERG